MVEAYAEALNMALDGDVAGASARMMEAQAKREEQLRAQLTSEVQQHSTRRQLQQELDLVTEALEAQFEDLRPGSENYNAELVDDIIAVRDGLMAGRSLRPGQALERAAQLVLADRFVGSTGVDEPAPTPPSKPKSLQKQVDAANRQAPSTAGRGADTSGDYQKVDVFTMSEEDFENLSEAELRRLRGDFG